MTLLQRHAPVFISRGQTLKDSDLPGRNLASLKGHTFYGPGIMEPFKDTATLTQFRHRLVAAVGLLVHLDSVTLFSPRQRAVWGEMLRGWFPPGRFYVFDDLSAEWALHFGIDYAQVGADPTWLYCQDWVGFSGTCGEQVVVGDDRIVYAVSTMSQAYAAAFAGFSFLLDFSGGTSEDVPIAGGSMDQKRFSPLLRWAARYGCSARIYHDKEQFRQLVKHGVAAPFNPEQPKQEQRKAEELLIRLLQPSPQEVATGLPPEVLATARQAQAVQPADAKPRVIEPGTVFDPTTHYTDHYYDGRGIVYTKPDGTQDVYHGTAREWAGNKTIARILHGLLRLTVPQIGKTPPRSLDIGCGAGDFVRRLAQLKWDAHGIDLGDAAKRPLHPNVVVGDITKGEVGGQFDVTTALDFWEHVWRKDLDELLAAIHELTVPGGLHFACICTRGESEKDFVAEPGVTFTQQNSWLLISGHVHVRSWTYWATKFRRSGWRLRHDLMNLFQVARAGDPGLESAMAWGPRNTLIVQKER